MIHAWPRGNSIYSAAGRYPRLPPSALGRSAPVFLFHQGERMTTSECPFRLPPPLEGGDTHRISHLFGTVAQVPTGLQRWQGPCTVQLLFNGINGRLCLWTHQGHRISTFTAPHDFGLHLQYSWASCRVLRKGSLKKSDISAAFCPERSQLSTGLKSEGSVADDTHRRTDRQTS